MLSNDRVVQVTTVVNIAGNHISAHTLIMNIVRYDRIYYIY